MSRCISRILLFLAIIHLFHGHVQAQIDDSEWIDSVNFTFSAFHPKVSIDSSLMDSIIPIIPTFLGNNQRNYYGDNCPDTLELIWKHHLGTGKTVISRRIGSKTWSGAGWTGQPLLIEEHDTLYLIQGAYDHHLKKIRAADGQLIWQYKFDDVVKGTGSFYKNSRSAFPEQQYLILQGSRLGIGNYLDSKFIPSYRAVSYITGKEQWRLNVKWTDSYSRDVDASALILDSLAYIGLENSLFTILDPHPAKAKLIDDMFQPEILGEHKLYTKKDVHHHGSPKVSNIVTEASPALLDSFIFIASGSGHLFRYNMRIDSLDWDFYIGSDIDGSPVITEDSCVLVTIEKQYIKGHGGVYKFNPYLPVDSSVVWYRPTKSRKFEGWKGGIIGSAGINDSYVADTSLHLAVISAIDGYMYVVNHQSVDSTQKVWGPRKKYRYDTPVTLFKYKIGPSISTPLIFKDKIVAASYNGLFLFTYNEKKEFKLIASYPGSFESTPICWENRVYIASRDGYLYCFGLD